MKLGIAISVLMVAGLGLVLFFNMRGVADAPTAATSPEKLVAIMLPGDLRPLYESTQPHESANNAYAAMFDVYRMHHRSLRQNSAPTAIAIELCDLLEVAMQAGRVQKPFLDDQIPMRLGASPEFGDALEAVPGIALAHARTAWQRGDLGYSESVARAVFALGHRAYTQSVHFYNRQVGLMLMMDACGLLYEMRSSMADGGELLDRWIEALRMVDSRWSEKARFVTNLRVHIGDLIRMAKSDEDRTFRIRALQQIGVMKFNARTAGNRRALQSTLDDAMKSDDKMIAEAAAMADAMTREDLGAIR